jgi:pimeloyl-ACP methyl ester carboxylesterase
MLARRNFSAIYEGVRAPVLIVQGERDRLVPLEFSLAIGRRYGWPVQVLPDVGHIPMLEVPDRFVVATLGWLDRLPQAAAV